MQRALCLATLLILIASSLDVWAFQSCDQLLEKLVTYHSVGEVDQDFEIALIQEYMDSSFFKNYNPLLEADEKRALEGLSKRSYDLTKAALSFRGMTEKVYGDALVRYFLLFEELTDETFFKAQFLIQKETLQYGGADARQMQALLSEVIDLMTDSFPINNIKNTKEVVALKDRYKLNGGEYNQIALLLDRMTPEKHAQLLSALMITIADADDTYIASLTAKFKLERFGDQSWKAKIKTKWLELTKGKKVEIKKPKVERVKPVIVLGEYIQEIDAIKQAADLMEKPEQAIIDALAKLVKDKKVMDSQSFDHLLLTLKSGSDDVIIKGESVFNSPDIVSVFMQLETGQGYSPNRSVSRKVEITVFGLSKLKLANGETKEMLEKLRLKVISQITNNKQIIKDQEFVFTLLKYVELRFKELEKELVKNNTVVGSNISGRPTVVPLHPSIVGRGADIEVK